MYSGLGSNNSSQFYDRVVQAVPYLVEQCWGVPLSIIIIMLLDLEIMNLLLRTGFVDSDKIYEGTNEDIFHGFCKGNVRQTGLWICISFKKEREIYRRSKIPIT